MGGGRGRRAALAASVLLAAVLVAAWPFLDAAEHRPVLDQAVHELRIRDVGTADTPLIGPAASGGANHAGPLGFWTLAVPYRLGASSSKAAVAGAALVAFAAGVTTVALVRRLAGGAAAWVAAVGTVGFAAAFGVDRIYDVWNAHLTLLPLLATVVAAWAVRCGHAPALVALALAGSFTAQNHLSMVLPVVAVGVWALLGLRGGVRRRFATEQVAGAPGGGSAADGVVGALPSVGGWVLVATALGVACWLGPIAQQATAERGNLTALVDYAEEPGGDEPASLLGWAGAIDVAARHLGGWPTWAGAPEATEAERGVVAPGEPWWLLTSLVPLLAAGGVAWWCRHRRLALAVGTVAVAGAASLAATARIDGEPYLHYTRAFWVVGITGWWCVAAAAVAAVDHVRARPVLRLRPARRWVVEGALAALVAVLVTTWAVRPPHPWPSPPREVALVATIDALAAGVPDDLPPPLRVEGDATFESVKLRTALELALERRGIPVAVREVDRRAYGGHRADRVPAGRLVVLVGATSVVPGLDDAVLLATHDDVRLLWDPTLDR